MVAALTSLGIDVGYVAREMICSSVSLQNSAISLETDKNISPSLALFSGQWPEASVGLPKTTKPRRLAGLS